MNDDVTWSATGGEISGSGGTITWTAPVVGGTFALTATSVLDPAQSATVALTMVSVGVSVLPDTVTVAAGSTTSFSAMVSGAIDSTVTWRASGCMIAGAGRTIEWTAPAIGGEYTITTTSVVDSAQTASAQVTVTPIMVSIPAVTRALFRGESPAFTAMVSGAAPGAGAVPWTSTCGERSPDGLTLNYTAPNTPGSCTITAIRVADTTRRATITVAIRRAYLVSSDDDISDGACSFAHCSLREALAAANSAADADTILLGADAIAPLGDTIRLTSALPTISTPMTIVGPGSGALVILAQGTVIAPRRILLVSGPIEVAVRDVRLSGGRAALGGALLVQSGATLSLTRVAMSDNEAFSGSGGAVASHHRATT